MNADENQRAYLLQRLQQTGGKSTWSKLIGAKTALARAGLNVEAARQIMGQLVREGDVDEHKRGKSVSYLLTESGIAQLQKLVPPPEVEEENSELSSYRQAWLLLQLLMSDDQILEKSLANKFSKSIRDDLGLNTAIANRLRATLASEGMIRVSRDGRKEFFHLTDAGKVRLAALNQHPGITFALRGRVINELLHRARSEKTLIAESPTAYPAARHAANPLQPGDLCETVYSEFSELRRERFSHTKLVPLYEIRRRIAQKHGEHFARHDVLDEAILELWRRGRVRITPISDMRDATEDQRADSINDSYQTLFYMENVDGNGSSNQSV